MRSPIGVRRVILLVLDGLRPDAIERFNLHQLRRLQLGGASTDRAVTVDPSVTAAAVTSLLTGVSPERHGVRSDRIHIPPSHGNLMPFPRLLADANYPVSSGMSEVPLLFRGIASRITRRLGISESRFAGIDSAGVLMATRNVIGTQRRGLVFMHWPDADRAGHAHGWMSPQYGQAAYRMDATLGLLTVLTEVPRDPATLLVVLTDHGGGGADPRNHDSAHPDDRTIFVTFAGGAVQPTRLPDGISILDVAPTILWALGVPVPRSYEGRVLQTAFRLEGEPEPAVA